MFHGLRQGGGTRNSSTPNEGRLPPEGQGPRLQHLLPHPLRGNLQQPSAWLCGEQPGQQLCWARSRDAGTCLACGRFGATWQVEGVLDGPLGCGPQSAI